MCRFLSVFFVSAVVFLYVFSFNNTLSFFAKTNIKNVVVLCDEKDEQLVSISEEDLDAFLSKLNLQNRKEFYIEDRLIIEGYSSKFNNYIIFNNIKTNIQISINNGVCLIGSPIIKNSF